MRLLFVGDLMPGGVLPYQGHYIDNDLFAYMKGFDFRIGTLECGVGSSIPFDERKMKSYKSIVYVREEDLRRLAEMGINAVSLANNHALDLGIEGLENAMAQLDRLGIAHFGAGMNIAEAKKPVIIKDGDDEVAVFGCMFDYRVPNVFYSASENDPGVYHTNIDEVVTYIKELKREFKKVVVMPHWGEEHKYIQPEIFKMYAHQMLSAGADCIIGDHPHIINPAVAWGGKKCYFSLGNFLFPDKCMQVPRPVFYPDSVEELTSLKRVWTYPKAINQPVVAVWKPKNRIGMMVEMETSKNLRSNYKLVSLSAENVLSRYSSWIVRSRMAVWSLLMRLPGYRFVFRAYNHRFNFISRFIDRLPSFNVPVKL